MQSDVRSFFGWLATAFFGFCVLYMAYGLTRGDSNYFECLALRNEKSALQAKLDDLQRKQAVLSDQIKLLQTDSTYLEKIIRQRLNYVREGEVLYIFDENEQPRQKGLGFQTGTADTVRSKNIKTFRGIK